MADVPSPDYDDEKTPVSGYQAQIPPSLRGLFDRGLPRDEAVQTPVRRVPIPNISPEFTEPPPQRIEIPDFTMLNSPPIGSDLGDAATARPNDFQFPRNGSSTDSPPPLPKKGDSRRGPSQSFTDSERDTPSQTRRVFSDEESSRGKRNGVSPANFTFPANSGGASMSMSNSSPASSQSPSASGHTPAVSTDENHLPTLNVPPPLSRSNSATPYVPPDNTGFVRPPLPQPMRQQSTSALEPPRPRPFRSGSTSAQMEGTGSTLVVPEPSALRKALNVSV